MASEVLAGILSGMGTQAAGSIIGAGTSLLAQQFEQEFNAEQADINRQFQSTEAEKARSWNEEMWNKQNEYNTPVAQYQRLRDLGINPATALGMLGNGSGNATQAATAQSAPSGAQASTPSIAGQLGQYFADIPKVGMETAVASEDWYTRKIQNEIAAQTKQDYIAMAHLNVEEASKRIDLLINQARTEEQKARLIDLQSQFQGLNNDQFKACMEYNIKLAEANYDLAKANINKTNAQTALTLAQEGKIKYEEAALAAEAYYNSEAAKYAGKMTLEQWLVNSFGDMAREGILNLGDSIVDLIDPKHKNDPYTRKTKRLLRDYKDGRISGEEYDRRMVELRNKYYPQNSNSDPENKAGSR